MQKNNEEKKVLTLEEFEQVWKTAIVNLAIQGEPIYRDGEIQIEFEHNSDLYCVSFKKCPSNIIQFPEKKKLPKRI